MNTVLRDPPQRPAVRTDELRYIFHPSFEETGAEAVYGAAHRDWDKSSGFMPDEVTRDLARRMHYASWRACEATTPCEAACWRRRYYNHRDCIVLGNRKLTFRAVHRWGSTSRHADDMASECQYVLVKAVAAFNPWLGIRFSTYAFTCLIRALSRLSQRHAADRLTLSLPLEALPQGEPCYENQHEQCGPRTALLGEYLRAENTLLTSREKLVLSRRFHLNDEATKTETLEQVGRDLGLSKERVRQVQNSALGKLREALLSGTPA